MRSRGVMNALYYSAEPSARTSARARILHKARARMSERARARMLESLRALAYRAS